MAGRGTGGQIDHVGEIRAVRRSEVSNVDATARAAQRRCQRDEQQRRELVLRRMVARVVNAGKDRQNRFHARCLLKQGTLLRIHVRSIGMWFFLCAIRLPTSGRWTPSSDHPGDNPSLVSPDIAPAGPPATAAMPPPYGKMV